MTTRKQQLFEAKKKTTGPDMIPSTVSFKLDKKKGALKPMSAEEKMVCALRKVLTDMSDGDTNRCRYYIDSQIKPIRRPAFTRAANGGPTTYRAAGICKVGVCHPQGYKSSKIIQFDISYRDVKDSKGQPDVEYMDPTTIDELSKKSPVNTSSL